jgi:Fe-S oxidoreductase, related to NifB/MoaA family
MYNTVASVDPGCPLEGKVFPGDELHYVNHHPIRDVLDYKYWTYDEKLLLEFKNAGKIRVRKEAGQDLGLNFETYLMDRPTGCANRCVFCFVDQLPRGMRSTLYFKDDDARLSFLTGNYITCTNLSKREMERICALRISPLNISVHATDGALRARLLGNPRGAEILDVLRRFSDAGIFMDCQIVAVPGWNDGEALQKTMEDLASFFPQVGSVSVVPVGLTRHREGLTPLSPFTKEEAYRCVRQVEAYAEVCRQNHDSSIFFCSDELYLKAGLPLPPDEYYEGYPQLENGVGLLRLQETEFDLALEEEGPIVNGPPFSLATGAAAAPFLRALAEKAGANGTVYAVPNDFLGHTIDVAGLLTGGDLIKHLRGKALGDRLLLPQVMLRHGEGVFLDDLTPADLERELGVRVKIVEPDGARLLTAMRGE